MDLIDNLSDWRKEYRKDKTKIWYRAVLSNGSEYYFKDYKDWFKVKSFVEKKSLEVSKIRLQYRSHVVEQDFAGCDGVYLVRSILGRVGGESIETVTVGKIMDKEVHKTVWTTPDLVAKDSQKDRIENCFKEAVICWN